MTPEETRPTGKRHPGPPLAVPAILFAVLFLVAALAGPISGAGPMPGPDAGDAVAYAVDNPGVAQAGGMALVYAGLSLALFSAIAYSRLTFLAPNAPGPAIAGFGGLLAGASLLVGGTAQWTLSRSDVLEEPALVHALQYVTFLAGGPAHTVALSLLMLGLAVTTWFVRRTPPQLSQAGFVVAALCLLSGLTLASSALAPLVLVSRVAAIVWILTLAVLLPRHRAPRGRRTAEAVPQPA